MPHLPPLSPTPPVRRVTALPQRTTVWPQANVQFPYATHTALKGGTRIVYLSSPNVAPSIQNPCTTGQWTPRACTGVSESALHTARVADQYTHRQTPRPAAAYRVNSVPIDMQRSVIAPSQSPPPLVSSPFSLGPTVATSGESPMLQSQAAPALPPRLHYAGAWTRMKKPDFSSNVVRAVSHTVRYVNQNEDHSIRGHSYGSKFAAAPVYSEQTPFVGAEGATTSDSRAQNGPEHLATDGLPSPVQSSKPGRNELEVSSATQRLESPPSLIPTISASSRPPKIRGRGLLRAKKSGVRRLEAKIDSLDNRTRSIAAALERVETTLNSRQYKDDGELKRESNDCERSKHDTLEFSLLGAEDMMTTSEGASQDLDELSLSHLAMDLDGPRLPSKLETTVVLHWLEQMQEAVKKLQSTIP